MAIPKAHSVNSKQRLLIARNKCKVFSVFLHKAVLYARYVQKDSHIGELLWTRPLYLRMKHCMVRSLSPLS